MGRSLRRAALAVVLDRVRLVGALLPVDHQVIQVDDPAGAVVMAVVLGVVAQVFIGHVDLVPVGLVVAQFVDGVGDGVGFDDKPERRVGAAKFQEPGLAEPAIGVEDGDVGQVVVVELAGCGDLLIGLVPSRRVIDHTLLLWCQLNRRGSLAAGEVGSDSGDDADFMVVGIATALGAVLELEQPFEPLIGAFAHGLAPSKRVFITPSSVVSVGLTLRPAHSPGHRTLPGGHPLPGSRLDRRGSRRRLGRLSLEPGVNVTLPAIGQFILVLDPPGGVTDVFEGRLILPVGVILFVEDRVAVQLLHQVVVGPERFGDLTVSVNPDGEAVYVTDRPVIVALHHHIGVVALGERLHRFGDGVGVAL